MISRIRVDFNGFRKDPIFGDFLSLDNEWTRKDMNTLGLNFQEGLEAIFYEYEGLDVKGNDIFTWAKGIMKHVDNLGWIA